MRGDAEAETSLAWLYEEGYGVPKDPAQAVHWYRLAAEQENPESQRSLAQLTERGAGTRRDAAEAAKWYASAAEHGDAAAAARLAELYSAGRGVARDDATAYFWLSVARKQGATNTDKLRAVLGSKLAPEQIAKAEESARAWKPKVVPRKNLAPAQ
jgi:TPR repeat protein